MMYSEFVKNTGCKETDKNYKLFKRLELIYSNDEDITKEEIYDMGRKLMDNSLSEKQEQWNAEMKAQIEEKNEELEYQKTDLARDKDMLEFEKMSEDRDDWYIAQLKKSIQYKKDRIKELRNDIKNLKDCMYK